MGITVRFSFQWSATSNEKKWKITFSHSWLFFPVQVSEIRKSYLKHWYLNTLQDPNNEHFQWREINFVSFLSRCLLCMAFWTSSVHSLFDDFSSFFWQTNKQDVFTRIFRLRFLTVMSKLSITNKVSKKVRRSFIKKKIVYYYDVWRVVDL